MHTTNVTPNRAGHWERADRLRIGLIAPPWVPVPPTEYGGTELVLDLLARGLRAAGHDVTLFTTGDSTCDVPREWLYPTAMGTTASLDTEVAHVERAYELFADVDVIHDHTLAGPTSTHLHPPGVPIVTTNHGPFTDDLRRLYATAARNGVAVVSISHDQRRRSRGVPIEAVIHHGLDLKPFPVGAGDGGYVVFLGRMHEDKGVHRAIEVARAAGKRILIAAKMWEPAEHRYYAEKVEPLLGDDAEYIGQVGGHDKIELLAGAEALVNPIRWPEPFGLVMIEALAVGTPVVAFPEGAAPEIVQHGRNGYLCRDEDEMVAHLARVGDLDRRECRRSAEEHFTVERMVADHVALYRRLLAERSIPPEKNPPLALAGY
jgi:glycosyltransferase involved in cell wall biosynthesis